MIDIKVARFSASHFGRFEINVIALLNGKWPSEQGATHTRENRR
ncbi:hypothetical protein QZH46_09680 [Pseudomonas corrugata]